MNMKKCDKIMWRNAPKSIRLFRCSPWQQHLIEVMAQRPHPQREWKPFTAKLEVMARFKA